MHSVMHKWHELSPAVTHRVVNKEEWGRCVSVNKDSVNQSRWVRGEWGLLINAGTASSKSQRDWGKQHPHSKATKLPHAKLLCPPCVCLSLSVSPHCLRFPCTLALLCLSRRLHTSALSCSTHNWRVSPLSDVCRWLLVNNFSVDAKAESPFGFSLFIGFLNSLFTISRGAASQFLQL